MLLKQQFRVVVKLFNYHKLGLPLAASPALRAAVREEPVLDVSCLFTDSWYAWQDSNLRPVAPEESGSNPLNLLSLFLTFTYTFSGILLSLEVDPLFCQIDRVLVQFRYSVRSRTSRVAPANPCLAVPTTLASFRESCLRSPIGPRLRRAHSLPPSPPFGIFSQKSASRPSAPGDSTPSC